MDPRISPIKPHQGFRQLQRHSQRRYKSKANGHSVRYIPPPELRQPTYVQNGATESRRYDDLSTFVKQDQHERATSSSHINNNYQMSSRTSAASPVTLNTHSDNSRYVCVSMDYVPDRGRMLWSRWILIVLCLGQLISASAVIGCHAIDFSEDTKLEIGVSLGLLAFGNIFASGIVTGVLFFSRWKNEEVRAKSEGSEANHEAWICTKAALSLIGMAPISRYVELFAVYRRLTKLERRLNKEQASAANSTSVQNRESLSQSPPPSVSLDPSQPDRDRERLNQLRRLFIQLDFDACVVGLANATLGAGPFAIAQGVLYLRRLMLNRMMSNSTGGAILASFVFSLLWLTSTACQFQPDAHYLPPSQLLRKAAHQHDHLVSASGRILLFFARGFHITIRMITFTLFAGLFGWMLGVVVVVHALFYLIILMIYRGNRSMLSASYKPNPSYRRPLDQRLQSKGILRHLGTDLLYTFVSIYDFFNGSAGKTRLRVILYYFAYYLENASMIGAWYTNYPFTAAWYYLPILLVVVTVQWMGAIFLQLYFFYFSSSPRGTSLCGLCCPDELRGPIQLVYSPVSTPTKNPAVQWAQPLSPPLDNPSFILQPTSLYSYRSPYDQRGSFSSHPRTAKTDSLTVVTAELPKKPRSKYLYVKNVEDEEPIEFWNEWQGVEVMVVGGGSNV